MRSIRRFATTVVPLAICIAWVASCIDDSRIAGAGSPLELELPIPVSEVFEHKPMLAVAKALPATFGGFWYNENDEIVVGMTDLKDFEEAVALIKPWITAHQPKGYVSQTVEYPFLLLAAYRTVLSRELGRIPGFSAIGVRESANRVKIEASAQGTEALHVLLTTHNIPVAAVMFLPAGDVRATSDTLRGERTGALYGGWQISKGSETACTLGFAAIRVSNGDSTFVTNSHCSETSWGTSNDYMYQPLYAYGLVVGDTVAHEVVDPTPYSCYYSSTGCRNADAALYSAWQPIDVGYIARTTNRSNCESCEAGITVDANNPRIRITSRQDYSYENEVLDKIGRTTGWTYGAVEDTCDSSVVDGVYIPCRDRADYFSDDGDSGAPVFWYNTSNGTAELRGLNFGSWHVPATEQYDGLYAPLGEVENDLGALIVDNPFTTASIEGDDLIPPNAYCQWTGFPGGVYPFTYEWRKDGVVVSSDQIYTLNGTGTTDFELSFKVTDSRGQFDTDYLSVVIDMGDPGFICDY